MAGSSDIIRIIKDFLFSKTNREFLIFLFFLILSGAFWLSLTLNDTYEKEFSIPVTVSGIPRNVVLTSNETDTVKVTIRDKGIALLMYQYGDVLKMVKLPFKTYAHPDGTGQVPVADIQKAVYQSLPSSARITAAKPERIEFYYNYGAKKKVPLRWSGRVIPEELFFISHVEYSPDSITVYASEEKLDSINAVYTEQLNYVGFRDTLAVNCNVRKQKGVKTVPEQVKVTFFTDVLTEESFSDVPITGINLPEGKVLRTFPSKVTVRFVTGVNVYRTLQPEDFTVVADYKELRSNPSEKCRIYLRHTPHGISRARLETTEVDYLIEEQPQ